MSDITVTDRTGAENVAAVLGAYERSLDRLAHTLVAVNRLGLSERKMHLDHADAVRVAEAVRRAVYSNDVDITFEQGQDILGAIAREFTALLAE